MRFVIRRSSTASNYFTITGGNNEIMVTSENYISKSSAQHAINVIKGSAGNAQIVDLT